MFAGRFERGAFIAEPLREQRKSNIDRYYYSSYDHELSPAWLPEGNGLVLIANPETPYGTGSLLYSFRGRNYILREQAFYIDRVEVAAMATVLANNFDTALLRENLAGLVFTQHPEDILCLGR